MTRDAASFDRLYVDLGDPWNYETSSYEADKYRRCLALLPKPSYCAALEIGCSIGVMSEQVAARCDRLLGVDFAPTAIAYAQARGITNARFQTATVPNYWPAGSWDLIVLSEVLYYLSSDALERTIACVTRTLALGGACLVAGYTGNTETRLTASEANARLLDALKISHPRHAITRDRAPTWTAAAFQCSADGLRGK